MEGGLTAVDEEPQALPEEAGVGLTEELETGIGKGIEVRYKPTSERATEDHMRKGSGFHRKHPVE